MKKKDLKNIEQYYNLYNVLLFNNSLPLSSKIDFKLHNLTYAAGYSKYNDKPSKQGNHHEIAFCKFYKFTNEQIQEILIHEMIHLWQVYHVKEDRYKKCSNDIAHDRVFVGKMNTINLLLERNGYFLTIAQTFNDKLYLDEINSTKEFRVIFFEDYGGKHMFTKVSEKNYQKVVQEYLKYNKEKELFKNIYSIKTKSYVYNLLKYSTKREDYLQTAKNPDNERDLYDANIDDAIWIIKDENVIE